MRLRSTQFVFLLLLVCSVQQREQFALRLLAGDISGQTANEPRLQQGSPVIAPRTLQASPSTTPATRESRLDSASLAAYSTVWTMRRPALASAAVSSFTGFLRA